MFKPDFLIRPSARYRRDDDFLTPIIAQEVEEKIKDHARSFKKVAIISPAHLTWTFEGDYFVPAPNLGLPNDAYDLVLHLHGLHADNDVVGQLIQSRMALKPDGVFIAAFLGGESLKELRTAMMQAEIEVAEGASQRVAPMIDIRDAGGLLSRAGFALPVADNWPLKVRYQDVRRLISDLRRLGLSGAMQTPPLTRNFLTALDRHYQPKPACGPSRLEASFELIFLTGYAPSANQPTARKPGSITTSLFEAIEKTKS